MRIAIFESIWTPAGHEIEFDRILSEELSDLGHEVVFYVPEGHTFQFDYQKPINYLPGRGVSYTGVSKLQKTLFSLKREFNRLGWYRALHQEALKGAFDAIIVPTSTYRYFRSLTKSCLKNSPVPLLFIVHGVNPRESTNFFKQVEQLRKYPEFRAGVLTFGQDIFGRKEENVYCLYPPVYTPRDITVSEQISFHGAGVERPLRLGFFGQYRREKKLDAFLDAFLACRFEAKVELLVQGATMRTEDAADFERIQKQYGHHSHIKFWHKALIGKEWQEALAGIDALVMPYAAERYRYHWGGMLFTALGFFKPVVITDNINPEVIQNYDIGVHFPAGDSQKLTEAIEKFVNTFPQKTSIYEKELCRANEDFSPELFAKKLLELLRK
ncbi:MAG TPA: glycosyltransferase [Bacillota bacterium]|nr:glycosyltransferase [Bacillota bacterium]